MTALIVEDSDDSRELLARWLRRDFSLKVIETKNGEEGLEKLQSEGPDIVFLDIMMPAMNGLEMLRRLRATPGHETTPVVILTARREDTFVKEALRLKVDAYVLKPFTLEGLRTHAGRLIEGIRKNNRE